MTRTTVGQSIKIFLVVEFFILATYFYSTSIFANVQVAFLSSLCIILGSAFAYKKMVQKGVASDSFEEKRDLLDEIEDPHELYDNKPINETPVEELDLKAIVKEEKAKIKTFNVSSMKYGARGGVSLFRLVPYLLLILGFIALKNNNLLELKFYLPSLLLGIVVASVITKKLS